MSPTHGVILEAGRTGSEACAGGGARAPGAHRDGREARGRREKAVAGSRTWLGSGLASRAAAVKSSRVLSRCIMMGDRGLAPRGADRAPWRQGPAPGPQASVASWRGGGQTVARESWLWARGPSASGRGGRSSPAGCTPAVSGGSEAPAGSGDQAVGAARAPLGEGRDGGRGARTCVWPGSEEKRGAPCSKGQSGPANVFSRLEIQ